MRIMHIVELTHVFMIVIDYPPIFGFCDKSLITDVPSVI